MRVKVAHQKRNVLRAAARDQTQGPLTLVVCAQTNSLQNMKPRASDLPVTDHY